MWFNAERERRWLLPTSASDQLSIREGRRKGPVPCLLGGKENPTLGKQGVVGRRPSTTRLKLVLLLGREREKKERESGRRLGEKGRGKAPAYGR